MSNSVCLPLHPRANAKVAKQEVYPKGNQKDSKGTAGDDPTLDTSMQTAQTTQTSAGKETRGRKAPKARREKAKERRPRGSKRGMQRFKR